MIGQIEGHIVLPSQNKTTKYEHVLPQLVAIEQNEKIRGLVVLLNTVGGDVEAGLAIAEMVRSLGKPSVSVVLGGGHSIGIPVAVAARRSFIAPTATMTIHPVRLTGMVIGVPQTYEYLDKMQERIVQFVVANSHISYDRYRELMFRTGDLARDVGTILVGREAVQEGLIDEVGGLAEAMAALRAMIEAERGARGASGDDAPERMAPAGATRPGAATDGAPASPAAPAASPDAVPAAPGSARQDAGNARTEGPAAPGDGNGSGARRGRRP